MAKQKGTYIGTFNITQEEFNLSQRFCIYKQCIAGKEKYILKCGLTKKPLNKVQVRSIVKNGMDTKEYNFIKDILFKEYRFFETLK